MLPKEHRLKKEKDIKVVFSSGKSVFDKACGAKFALNGLDVSRFAFVIGKKVHKSAVKRNRIRRQYRAMVKDMLPEIKPGHDIVLLIGVDALSVDFDGRKQRLQKVFEKAGII